MAEPLKNLLSPDVVHEIGDHLARTGRVDGAAFLARALPGLEDLELMQRSAHVAAALAAVLPQDFAAALDILRAVLHPETEAPLAEMALDGRGLRGWSLAPVGAYVAEAGQNHPEAALAFLREMTSRFSSEFALRPFLRDHPDLALAHVRRWARDGNAHVRRLASEGARPRLPWGLRLHAFIADPSPILPILEELRDDPSEYVRRSVANSLNDIAKDHPALVTELAARWMQGAPPARRALLKHACRSLIKAGDPDALAVFGYARPDGVTAELGLAPAHLDLGQTLTVRATLSQPGPGALPVLVDLVLGFRKAHGGLSPKVFKWTETVLEPGVPVTLTKNLPLRPVTTRRHYPGRHEIALQVNGRILAEAAFTLSVPG
jgi:3-methyladenine DNA glycosylase AlkC